MSERKSNVLINTIGALLLLPGATALSLSENDVRQVRDDINSVKKELQRTSPPLTLDELNNIKVELDSLDTRLDRDENFERAGIVAMGTGFVLMVPLAMDVVSNVFPKSSKKQKEKRLK